MTGTAMSSGNPARRSVADRLVWRARGRRAAAVIGMLAAVSFPELPKPPKRPEPGTVSLYVWNASRVSSEIAVAVDGAWVFREPLPAGEGLSRHDAVEVLPGDHRVEVVVAGTSRVNTVAMDPHGNHWLVVTWWGDALEVAMQQQPPWVVEWAS